MQRKIIQSLEKWKHKNQPQAIDYTRGKAGGENLGDETLWRDIL